MTTPPPLLPWLLGGFVVVAAAWDLRTRRIPNWLTLPVLVIGIVAQTALLQAEGLRSAGMGLGLALLITIPLFGLRALGGGDVKLLAAVGAIVGPGNFLAIFLVNAILGGAIAIVLIAWKRRLRSTFRNVGYVMWEILHLRSPYLAHEELDIGAQRALTLPRGPVVALACLLFLAAGVWS